MDGDNIVVRQRSLGFGRGLGIEGALNGAHADASFFGYFAGDAFFMLWSRFTSIGQDRCVILSDLFAPRFEQFRIAPDMLVPLLFGEVKLVFELLKFAAKSHQVL